MKLTVVLGASEEASFDINLYDNSFTRKWVEELSWCLDNCEFNQLEAFASLYSLEESVTHLIQACETINRYIPKFIDVKKDTLLQNQEYFNYLHTKFETLSGNFGRPTRLFMLAPTELKDAIRKLNFFVHRVETKASEMPMLYLSFDKDTYRRHPLEDSDYDFFEFSIPAGTLYLHYVELGKEFIDLYEDNLPIDYAALKNLHYYSGEATLVLDDRNLVVDPEYIKWLEKNNVDPYNKKLGHGKIPLGKVDDLEKAKVAISNYSYLNKIIIEE